VAKPNAPPTQVVHKQRDPPGGAAEEWIEVGSKRIDTDVHCCSWMQNYSGATCVVVVWTGAQIVGSFDETPMAQRACEGQCSSKWGVTIALEPKRMLDRTGGGTPGMELKGPVQALSWLPLVNLFSI